MSGRVFRPWIRNSNSAISLVVQIEMDKAAHWHEGSRPLLLCKHFNFDQPAFNGDFGSVQQACRRDEIEFIGIPQTDSAFQGLFHVAPGSPHGISSLRSTRASSKCGQAI